MYMYMYIVYHTLQGGTSSYFWKILTSLPTPLFSWVDGIVELVLGLSLSV